VHNSMIRRKLLNSAKKNREILLMMRQLLRTKIVEPCVEVRLSWVAVVICPHLTPNRSRRPMSDKRKHEKSDKSHVDSRITFVNHIRSILSLEGDAEQVKTVQSSLHDEAAEVSGSDLTEALKTPLEAHKVTRDGLMTVLQCMYHLKGEQGIHQFFSGTPADPVTARALITAFMQFKPGELGEKFHLSQVVDGLNGWFNYEAITCFTLACVSVDPKLFSDSGAPRTEVSQHNTSGTLKGPLSGTLELAAVALAFVARYAHNRPVEKLGPGFSALQDGVDLLVKHIDHLPRNVAGSVIQPVGGAAFAFLLFKPLLPTPEFVHMLTVLPEAAIKSLLSPWADSKTADGSQHALLDVIVRCDLESQSFFWSELLKTLFGDQESYFALLDYMREGFTGKSLRIAGAVTQLVQTVDAKDRVDQVQTLQFQLVQAYPRLINYGQGYDASILANTEPSFAKDVEDEMKLCFQKMYEQQYDIHDVISMLERLKHSDIPRDQDLFACMVHSLFDEYQFFPQYPVKALATTAVLFGSLVHFRLVEGVSLAIALKFVLDALRQDVDSNMFRFGLQALVELRQRLEEFPKYCKVLLTIPGLRHQHQFYAQIRAIADPTADDERVELFRSINFTLIEEEAEPPGLKGGKRAEDAMKRVSLLVNNLTAKNVAEKAPDALREIELVGPAKFAKTLVARATKEANYHEIYAGLVDLLPTELNSFCVNIIVAQMAAILNSPDSLSTEKRLSLKNLGQFLGMLTLARNRPILFSQLHLRLLLAEGVRHEKLPAVLPLVAKIMVQTAKSKVFVPTSPWVEGVLSVLSELYAYGNLKLTMKFEIEVLGKAIGVDILALEPSVYIRDESKQVEDLNAIITTLGGPVVGNGLLVSVAPPSLASLRPSGANSAVSGAVPGMTPGTGPGTAPGFAAGGFPSVGAVGNVAVGESLGTSGAVNGSGVPLVGTTEFVTHPGLRQLLDVARSKTLVDVLLPVIDRAVSIASFTAKELVLKDLAREPDEGMLQAASHAQALVLASSMAIVTAKDPFVEALTHNLRALMLAQGHGESPLLLEQTQVAARETMDSLVSLIESVAREKVIAEVDEALLPSYQSRALARAQNRAFEPENYVESPIALPDLLAVRKGGLLPEQMAVYDNFASQAARVFQENAPTEEDPYAVVDLVYREMHAEFVENLQKLVSVTQNSSKRLGDLHKNDEVLVTLSSLIAFVQRSVSEVEALALRFSHVVVQTLFGAESTASVLCRECLCYLLGDLCRVSSLTAKEVVLWLLYADDPKKYNANVIGTLLRSRLVTPTEIDAMLTKDLAEIDAKPKVLEYAVRLLLDALIGPEPYCLRSDFAGTILAISRLDSQVYPIAGILVQALSETRGQGTGNEGHVFAEWTRLMQHHAAAASPVLLHAFVRDLHGLGWGSAPDQLTHFVREAVNVSVQSYRQSRSFVGVDAVATLVATLLETAEDGRDCAETLLMLITMLVVQAHETDVFEPLVYYRLLSSIATALPVQYVGILGEKIQILQPLALPAFASQWMTLMAHRFVLGRLLDDREHWEVLYGLLKALFVFLRHCWLSPISADVKNVVYRGTERICLVILHDAPEFFVRYADELSALLISEFVQLRNLVLCAFPEGVALPHPVEMKETDYVEVSDEIKESVNDARALLVERNVQKLVENACTPRPQLTPQIVMAVQTALAYSKPVADSGVDFNTVSVSMTSYNALCTYVAHLYTQAPAQSGRVEDSGAAQFCGRMLLTLSRENRYAFVSAIANHLRYPEKHTYFFSRFILALFTQFGERMFKDGTVEARHVVTRVLLERLMAHRAHPWGLMATFAELLKSTQYNFWDMPFIKSSSELSELFSTLYAHISEVPV